MRRGLDLQFSLSAYASLPIAPAASAKLAPRVCKLPLSVRVGFEVSPPTTLNRLLHCSGRLQRAQVGVCDASGGLPPGLANSPQSRHALDAERILAPA